MKSIHFFSGHRGDSPATKNRSVPPVWLLKCSNESLAWWEIWGRKLGGRWRLVVARLVVVVGGGCGGCGGCWLLVVGCWVLVVGCWCCWWGCCWLLEKLKRKWFNMSSRPSRTKNEHLKIIKNQHKIMAKSCPMNPASSKWPFDSPNGGHLSPRKKSLVGPNKVTTWRTWLLMSIYIPELINETWNLAGLTIYFLVNLWQGKT